MTNTRITDPEILERRYPVILREFGLRTGSGGAGLHPGGDGVIRDIEFLEPIDVNILSERRVMRPYGMAGGEDGQAGRNLLIKADSGSGEQKILNLGGKNTYKVRPHDRFRLEAPGGGGYGSVAAINGTTADKKAATSSVNYRKSGSVLQRNLDAFSV
jgi:5-oxoprolinase (ATP-hydrolysing)